MTRGRRREHYQWNMDIIGVPDVTGEPELISSVTFFKRIGITAKDIVFKTSSRKNFDRIEALRFQGNNTDESQHVVLQIAAHMKKLRWIDMGYFEPLYETTRPLIIVPANFPKMELCCLTLQYLNAKQLWEGCKDMQDIRKYYDGLIAVAAAMTNSIFGNPGHIGMAYGSTPALIA